MFLPTFSHSKLGVCAHVVLSTCYNPVYHAPYTVLCLLYKNIQSNGLVEHDVGIRVEADIAIGPDTQGAIATVSGVSCAVLVPCK